MVDQSYEKTDGPVDTPSVRELIADALTHLPARPGVHDSWRDRLDYAAAVAQIAAVVAQVEHTDVAELEPGPEPTAKLHCEGTDELIQAEWTSVDPAAPEILSLAGEIVVVDTTGEEPVEIRLDLGAAEEFFDRGLSAVSWQRRQNAKVAGTPTAEQLAYAERCAVAFRAAEGAQS